MAAVNETEAMIRAFEEERLIRKHSMFHSAISVSTSAISISVIFFILGLLFLDSGIMRMAVVLVGA